VNYSKTNLSDVAFEFLTPVHIRLDSFRFQFQTKEWAGIHYPQGLPESNFGGNFKLILTPVPDHHLKMLQTKYNIRNWYCVLVQGDGLRVFAESILNDGVEEKGFSLRKLITNVLNFTGPWAVVFEPDHDFKLDPKHGTVDDIMNSITFSITVEKRGFICFGSSIKEN
jgi:hypothetical protein